MANHYHDPAAGTQNQGNMLGGRACIRQTKFFRQYESGNDVKALIGGPGHLQWDTNKKEGAYAGQPVWDHDQEPINRSQNRQASYETTSSDLGHHNDRRPLQSDIRNGHVNPHLQDIERKKAQREADRRAAVEAERIDDERVQREASSLLKEVPLCECIFPVCEK